MSERNEEVVVQLIKALSHIVDTRDTYTAAHQSRVAVIAHAIAGEMGFEGDKLQGVYLGALLHDIGKALVPREILTAARKLTSEEKKAMDQHPMLGYELVKSVGFKWPIHEVILQHHERLDGSGYPAQLKGDEICIEARVVAVADIYDAFTSDRCYRTSISEKAALSILKSMVDKKKVEPLVFNALVQIIKAGQLPVEEDAA